MCPGCITNLALIAAGASSTSGLTAFAAKFYKKKQTNQMRGKQNETGTNGIENTKEPNQSSQRGVEN
jgi:hypothetical protein